jgi:hypothetical protein
MMIQSDSQMNNSWKPTPIFLKISAAAKILTLVFEYEQLGC